jgi:hypothetical protein
MMISTPVNGSASQEMSGSTRVFPDTDRLLWNDGLGKTPLAPPPEPPWKPKKNLGLKPVPRTFSGGTTGGLPRETLSAIRVKFVPHPV